MQTEETTKTADKKTKKTLFYDLQEFKDREITVFLFSGETVEGRLIGYDEVANCILENKEKRKIIVLGKSISLVCGGN